MSGTVSSTIWNEEDERAYQQNGRGFRKGISTVEAVSHYTQWAAQGDGYDKDLCPGRYNGPQIACDVISAWFQDFREEKRIMDIAAGTGFVGQRLRDSGFCNIDALEPSPSMLEQAQNKGVYDNVYCDFLTEDPIPSIAKGSYDCTVVVGGMGEGHIPCCALNEMIRMTKQGGLICIVMREEYLFTVDEYKDRLEPTMDFFEMVGKWHRVSRIAVPHYFIDFTGIVYLYSVD